jgi:hypothetical protein
VIFERIVDQLLDGHEFDTNTIPGIVKDQIVRNYANTVTDLISGGMSLGENCARFYQELEVSAPTLFNRFIEINNSKKTFKDVFEQLESRLFRKNIIQKQMPDVDGFLFTIEQASKNHPFFIFYPELTDKNCPGILKLNFDVVNLERTLDYLLCPQTEIPEVPAPFFYFDGPFKLNDIHRRQVVYYILPLILRDLGPIVSHSSPNEKAAFNLASYVTPIVGQDREGYFQNAENEFSLYESLYSQELAILGIEEFLPEAIEGFLFQDLENLMQRIAQSGLGLRAYSIAEYQGKLTPNVDDMAQNLAGEGLNKAAMALYQDDGDWLEPIRTGLQQVFQDHYNNFIRPNIIKEFQETFLSLKSLIPLSIINSINFKDQTTILLDKAQDYSILTFSRFIVDCAKAYNVYNPIIQLGNITTTTRKKGNLFSQGGLDTLQIIGGEKDW